MLGFYKKKRIKTVKLTRTIAIYAKIMRFFNNDKLRGNLRNRIKLEGLIIILVLLKITQIQTLQHLNYFGVIKMHIK